MAFLPVRQTETDAETLRVIAGSELGRNILAQHAAEALERRRELVKTREKAQAALAVETKKRDARMKAAEKILEEAKATFEAARTALHAAYCETRAACHVPEATAARADLDLLATAPAAIGQFIRVELPELWEKLKANRPGYFSDEYAAELTTAERAAQALKLEALTDSEVADRLATLRKHIARKAPRAGMQAA